MGGEKKAGGKHIFSAKEMQQEAAHTWSLFPEAVGRTPAGLPCLKTAA